MSDVMYFNDSTKFRGLVCRDFGAEPQYLPWRKSLDEVREDLRAYRGKGLLGYVENEHGFRQIAKFQYTTK